MELDYLSIDEFTELYEEVSESIELSRKGFIQSSLLDDEGLVRTQEEARVILDVCRRIYQDYAELVEKYPSLYSIFEKDFGSIHQLIDRESLISLVLTDEYIFTEKSQMCLLIEDDFSEELAKTYPEQFSNWKDETIKNHEETQKIIKENFSLDLNHSQFSCHCINCNTDFRSQLREAILRDQIKVIDEAEDKIYELVVNKNISDVSNFVFHLKKKIERKLSRYKNRFKRSSFNKIEAEIKNHLRMKLSLSSDLGRSYQEKLKAFFNGLIVEDGYKPGIVSEEEFERFFYQLETRMWRQESFLKKDFKKFLGSILTLKRKDVSSGILTDYLGQFWLHSDARRMKRKIIYHMGPTNSGKTYHAIEALSKSQRGCYLAPLRLLAGELFDTLNNKGVPTNLLTGEEVIEVEGASHFSSTIEMAKLDQEFDCVVIDEVQMLSDSQRGWAWTRALVNMMSPEIHLCGDHSVLELVKQILILTGDELEVKEYTRMTELKIMNHSITLSQLEKADALIVFSRRNALKYKADLEKLDFKVSIVYGRLSPEVRREQARKFDQGETDVIVSTDAIAMGMNLPVKRIVFSALSKFINSKEYPLSASEIKQISGRAGRFKRFPTGFVTTLSKVENGTSILEEAIPSDLEQSKKAMVGPDLDIFTRVNQALVEHQLPVLSLSEFLRLFNTMIFEKPFYCTDLKEMIELAEMVEEADERNNLSAAEIFGFACAPVNLGLIDHVQYYLWILNHFVREHPIICEPIDEQSDNIDYLETAIKCVELYQWLARHFDNKNFSFEEKDILENKALAIDKLNSLLSEKITLRCSSCGCKLPSNSKFAICEPCFQERRGRVRRQGKMKQVKGHSRGGGKRKGPPTKKSRGRNSTTSASSFKKHR